jgi:ABC-type transport system involved in cytochrome c biogenesis ATPase subunit
VKLVRVQVKNYRSLFADPGGNAFTVDLTEGMNAFVGPNNTGKSNLLRAIALALDPDYPFDRARDMPACFEWAWPRVMLQFRSDGKGVENTLLRYCEEYERSLVGKPARTFAGDGEIRLVVTFRGNASAGGLRQEQIEIRGKGALAGDPQKLAACLNQFHRSIRFVLIESGVSLEQLLAGKFREILHTVIRQAMREAFEQAEGRRSGYITALQNTLLNPLRDQIGSILPGLFPEMKHVSLLPTVATIDETLSNVTINLEDTVDTSIAAKGTGVRGGVMVAMLRYLADTSKRSMVFAVEEPEAFLHPSAQESLREDLEKLAERKDVSLLVTTHSPFIPSRRAKAQVVAVSKDGDGRTRIVGSAAGGDSRASLLGGLFRDAAVAWMIERTAQVPPSARAVVFVEGVTDAEYLALAAKKTGREGLLNDLHIVPTGGASKLVVEAVLMKAQCALPVVAVLDSDEMGRVTRDTLVKRCGFDRKRNLVLYSDLWPANPADVEAEDLFPNALLQSFVDHQGESTVLAEKVMRKELDAWHYGFNATGKDLILGFLVEHSKERDFTRWVELLELIRERADLEPASESADVAG